MLNINAIFLVLIVITFFSEKGKAQDSVFTHQIDTNVWLPSPINQKKYKPVKVYFGDSNYNIRCEPFKKYLHTFFTEKTVGESIGVSCSELRALTAGSKKNKYSEQFKRFLAAHEAFHISVQFTEMKTLLAPVPLFNGQPQFILLLDVVSVLESDLSTSQKCSQAKSQLDSIETSHRNHLLWRANYEWVAEFYAKEHIFGDNVINYNNYKDQTFKFFKEQLREPILKNGDLFYRIGLDVIQSIESKQSREQWQHNVFKGDALFDLYLEVNGCHFNYSKNWDRLQILEYNLIN